MVGVAEPPWASRNDLRSLLSCRMSSKPLKSIFVHLAESLSRWVNLIARDRKASGSILYRVFQKKWKKSSSVSENKNFQNLNNMGIHRTDLKTGVQNNLQNWKLLKFDWVRPKKTLFWVLIMKFSYRKNDFWP